MHDFTDDIALAKRGSTNAILRIIPSWLNFSLPYYWSKGSLETLAEAEKKLFALSNITYALRYVPLRDVDRQIWTLTVEADSSSESNGDRVPIVLLHSLGVGIGLWMLNLSSLSQYRKVYALDLLGFGKSSRCHFSSNPYVAEIEWVESIEEWRISLGLDYFYLLGHGLGGFLATSYALRYPHRVRRLILAEPWGIAEKPADVEIEPRRLPMWVNLLSKFFSKLNPLTALRAIGPWAPTLVRHLRPDLGPKFTSIKTTSEAVYDYIYQCNIQTPATGETAFCTLSDKLGWAHNPLIKRIGRLPIEIGISVIHGVRSWLDPGIGELVATARVSYLATLGAIDLSQLPVDSWSVQTKLTKGRVDVHIIPQAGHHVYSDQASAFNELINRILLEDDVVL